jgi:hypothetical protein
MNRAHTTIRHMSDRVNDDFGPGSIASRISLIWPLTQEITSLSKSYLAERRLQRKVTSLKRRKG